MIKTLIFDYDGTLHNTAKLYGKAFRKAYDWLVAEGKAKPRIYTDEETSIYLGMSAPAMWEAFMPRLEEYYKKTASAMIGQEMDLLVAEGEAVLYDGCQEVLQTLKGKGYQLVILSNCRHAYMEAHKRVFELEQYFDGFYAAEDFGFAPKEEIFETIQKHYPGEYVVIGDRASDLAVAVKHHLHSVACDYGFGEPEELVAAEQHIKDIKELLTIL
ncbi:MAG: HAD family hydrolase [Lachnospiraceae bacterium]|nr:HAD family hydrolase [Lachnospiraceae bacterium]